MWAIIYVSVIGLPLLSAITERVAKVRMDEMAVHGVRRIYGRTEVDTFLGVPYASPPIRNLRFRRPIPFQKYGGKIIATDKPPSCPQHSDQPIPYCDRISGYSEDCLYLNIFVPVRKSPKKLTVMFWIHGGAYSCGSNRLDVYDGGTLAAAGDVIVVTVNYRLGPLGFLYSNSTDAPGNMGLHDLLEALKWVNKNIVYFGGDKDSITIFGESVGAVTVAIFAISPLTKGLYKRAIMESFATLYLSDTNAAGNFNSTEKLARQVNCANDTFTLGKHPKKVVDCMRGIDTSRLIKEADKLGRNSLITQTTDSLLPKGSLESIKKLQFHSTELLIGFNDNEGSHFVMSNPKVFGPLGKYETNVNKYFAIELLKKNALKMDVDRVVDYYFGDLGEYDFDRNKQKYFLAYGDLVVNCPTLFFGERFAQNNDVYFYVFDHRPSNSPWDPELGVTHFDEVAFVFGDPVRYPNRYTHQEIDLSKRMMRYWTSFAKYGKPAKSWPLYNKQSHLVRVLNTSVPSPVEIVPSLENCMFLRRDLEI